MTGGSNLFCSYVPCSNNTTVKIADGSLTLIAGIGNIRLSQSLILKFVFHVPALKCNLISVSKITRDNHCFAKFLPFSCEFQDLLSGKMIGSARIHDDLYYFEDDQSTSRQTFLSGVASTSVSSTREIILWHHRLGHPSFSYLKHLFPCLFDNKNFVSLDCEICQLAKHTRISLSPKPYIPSTPFSLIYSDIWGPSKIITSHGKKWFVTFIDDHTHYMGLSSS